MPNITLRPDFRTMGGEISDLLYNQKFAGVLSVLYREGMRISGSLLLDNHFLTEQQKEEVIQFTQNYVQSLGYAMEVPEFDIFVSFGEMENMISSGQFLEHEYHVFDEKPRNAANKRKKRNRKQQGKETVCYELVIVDEGRNFVEYHIYGNNQRWIAEALMSIQKGEVIGEVHWRYRPSEEQIDHVIDLILADFAEDEIDAFVIHVKYHGETIAVEEIHPEEMVADNGLAIDPGTEDYSVVLIRDDGDALTFEIRRQSNGGIPIGMATVDVSQQPITGYVDFHEWEPPSNREHIAALLKNELDKELDFETFNLTFMHRSEPVEDMCFTEEAESVH